jgi:membrane-bound inhibitor of C-type lysozyme
MRLIPTVLVSVLAGAGLIGCTSQVTTKTEMPKQVTFICRAGKRIDATFYPTDDTMVDLKLSDGRSLSVPHTVSGSGARYATADGSFVFWNKGNTGFITEGAPDHETYSGCVIQ